MNGLFTLSDLRSLFGSISDAGLYKKLDQFIKQKYLIKVKRGLYALPSANLADISARLDPTAYISTGTVLAQNLLIGSIPGRRIQSVKIGFPRVYECAAGTIEYLSIAPQLFFGFTTENGLRMATPEKAWLDVCYYAYKGRRFSFDLDTDVVKDRFDYKRIDEYLCAYETRFRNHFNRTWR